MLDSFKLWSYSFLPKKVYNFFTINTFVEYLKFKTRKKLTQVVVTWFSMRRSMALISAIN